MDEEILSVLKEIRDNELEAFKDMNKELRTIKVRLTESLGGSK